MEEKQLVFHNCNWYIISSAEIFKVEINATTSFKCFVFKLSRMHLTLNIVSWAFRYILPLVLIIIKLKTLSDTKKNVTSLYEVQCALCLQGWLDWEFVSTNPRKYIYIYRIPMAIFSSFTNAGLLEYYMKWNVLSFLPPSLKSTIIGFRLLSTKKCKFHSPMPSHQQPFWNLKTKNT